MIKFFKGTTVEIRNEVLDKIKNCREFYKNSEAGGVLLGGYISDNDQYVITDITLPTSADISTFASFVRNAEEAQKKINDIWAKSEGMINYLGEWHTHISYPAIPSGADRVLMQTIIEDRSNVWDNVFLLIAGADNSFYLGISSVESNGEITEEIRFKEE